MGEKGPERRRWRLTVPSSRWDDAPALDGTGDRYLSGAAVAGDRSLVFGLLRGVTAFRVIALVWVVAAAATSTRHLARPATAAALVGVMVLWTALVSLWPRWGSVLPPTAPLVVATELLLGGALLVADGLVYASLDRPISLPWSWPAAGVMVAGLLYGVRAGLASSLLMVLSNTTSDLLLAGRVDDPARTFSRAGLWLVCGALAGYVAARLRQAAIEVSMARAREELARQLHDGVLQTLAVIQRRSDDRELAGLARDQELDLRRFLSSSLDRPLALEPELRRLAKHHEARFGSRVEVIVAADTPQLPPGAVTSLAGAVGEALTNTGKHAEASRVTVYVEPADGWSPSDDDGDGSGGTGSRGRDDGGRQVDEARVMVSVKDDGRGFDPERTPTGLGIDSSIRSRVVESGGRVQVTSRPGRGTEVRLWL
jgi:signal transduction histidine kinase